MEFHAGRQLDWFFKQWIYEAGHPVYDAVWNWDDATRQLRLRITQKQSGTLFRMPLDVEMTTGSGVRREVVEVSEREQSFTFELDRKPQTVRIDPGEWVLKVLTLTEAK
jgi:aminopeptidase N